MIINTQFSPADEIYFLNPINTKVVKSTVYGVSIEIKTSADFKKTPATVTYLVRDPDKMDEKEPRIFVKVDANRAFASKEELLKSL